MLEGASSKTIASGGRRRASAEKTCADVSGPSVAAGSGDHLGHGGGRRALARRETGDERLARRPDGGEHDQLRGAAVRLVGVVGDHRDPCVRAVERPRHERVLAERRRADHEDGVERLEDGTEPGPIGRQVAREPRMVLREPGPGAERLLPDRCVEPIRELDKRVPGPLLVRACTDHDGGALRPVEQCREGVDRGGVGGRGA